MKNRIVHFILPPLVPFLIVLICTQAAVQSGLIADYLVAPPSAVLRALMNEGGELWGGFLDTASSACAGLALSFIFGLSLAIVLSLSNYLRRAFLPYAIFFQTVPVIAIAPLLVIWFGFGKPTVIACSFTVSIFPIIASTLLGLQSTEPALLDIFHLYDASGWDIIWRLRLPFALPQIFSGLRIAAGLAVIGAIVGEFIGGGGLGAVIDAARTRQRIDIVFAAVLISSLLGLSLVGLINFFSWLALRRWHASARAS